MNDEDLAKSQKAAVKAPTGHHFARNLDWNLLRAFHDIVKANGISRAAQQTGQKQPALSMSLKRLEDHIGARLCRRGPGGFKLTREGEQIAETCESIFDSVACVPHSVADVATNLHGRVRIQLTSNLVDPRIDESIQSFHQAHKLVEIFVSVATWDVIQRSVLRNEVEIGIAPASLHHRDPDLHYDILFHEIYRPYCGRSHALFGATVDLPAELAKYPFVLTGADEPDQLTKFRHRYNLGRHVAGLSEQLEEARRLTVLGIGLCFLPEAFAWRDVVDGQLHPVLGPEGNPSSEILVISNPETRPHRARDQLLASFREVTSGNRGG